MFRRVLRFLASASLLVLLSLQVIAQNCPDVTPAITGPASVREQQSGVEYFTPLIAGHTYVWSLPLGGGTLGSTRTDGTYTYQTVLWNQVSGGIQNFQVKLAETYANCTDTRILNVKVNPLLHAYFYYTYDPTGGCY